MLFAEGEFAGGVGVAAEALVGAGEEEMGVGVGGVEAGGLFKVVGGGFELALLEEDAAEFEVSAGGVGLGGLGEDGGGFGEAALAEEEGSEVDPRILRREGAEGDGAAKMAFSVGIAAEGEVVEPGGAVDAGGRGRGEGESERFASEFELAEGLTVAGEEVAAIDGGPLELAGTEESGFGFGESVGGDMGEADAAPRGGVGLRVGEEEEEEEWPDHGAIL